MCLANCLHFLISRNAFILSFLLSENLPWCTIKIWHFRILNTLLSSLFYLFLRSSLLSIDRCFPRTPSFLSSNFWDRLLTLYVPWSRGMRLSVDSHGIIHEYCKAKLAPKAAVFFLILSKSQLFSVWRWFLYYNFYFLLKSLGNVCGIVVNYPPCLLITLFF